MKDTLQTTKSISQAIKSILDRHHSSNIPFPEYFRELKALSMKEYTVTLQPHVVKFVTNKDDSFTHSYPPYDVEKNPASVWTADKALPIALERVRSNITDYPTFLKEIASTGVHHYTIDFVNYEAKYFSKNEDQIFKEPLPDFLKN